MTFLSFFWPLSLYSWPETSCINTTTTTTTTIIATGPHQQTTVIVCGWWTIIWAKTWLCVYPPSNTPRSLRSDDCSPRQVGDPLCSYQNTTTRYPVVPFLSTVLVRYGISRFPPLLAPQYIHIHHALVFQPYPPLFSPSDMLNGDYVGCVRVSFLDTSTLAGRSGYFDSVGITRDILQVGHVTPTSFLLLPVSSSDNLLTYLFTHLLTYVSSLLSLRLQNHLLQLLALLLCDADETRPLAHRRYHTCQWLSPPPLP